jgi:hypothetical protein
VLAAISICIACSFCLFLVKGGKRAGETGEENKREMETRGKQKTRKTNKRKTENKENKRKTRGKKRRGKQQERKTTGEENKRERETRGKLTRGKQKTRKTIGKQEGKKEEETTGEQEDWRVSYSKQSLQSILTIHSNDTLCSCDCYEHDSR